jgi:hypothetical protein
VETFVLITGAWHGGRSRRPVAIRLRAAGHPNQEPFSDLDLPITVALLRAVES